MELQAAAHPLLLLPLVMVSATVVVVDKLPLAPVMITVAEPAVAELLAVNVRAEVALPLAGGVTGLGENDAVTPEGSPETLNVTAELKLPLLVTVIVLLPDPPWAMDRLLGEADNATDGLVDVPHSPPGPVQLPRSEVNSWL